MKLSVGGYNSDPTFLKAANTAASLEHIFGQGVLTTEIVELLDQDAFQKWIEKKLEDFPEAKDRADCPFVWVTKGNDSAFLGGWDELRAFAQDCFRNSSKINELFVNKNLPDEDDGKEYDFDFAVIGGGSGGLACAKEASTLGAKVVLFDFVKPSANHNTSWGLGGTCVNVGCIPKKLFHQAALLGENSEDMKYFGWEMPASEGTHNWSTMMSAVNSYIRSLNFGYRVELRKKGVEYQNKLVSFIDPHTLECGDKSGSTTKVTARRILIAVGGRPRTLNCPGGELAITSDDIFWKQDDPGKVLVIGASYIALECAGFLRGMKHDVTVLVRSIFLRGFDQDMANRVGDYMESHGTKFIRGKEIEKLEKTPEGRILATWTGGESDVFDTVLTAIGRDPDFRGLGLENAGVIVGKSGKIPTVNEQTNVPNIYAIGDVQEGHLELTPVAIESGKLLARRLYGYSTQQMDYNNVCTTVFTPLEYACCGMSEEVAVGTYGEEAIDVYHTAFTPLEWTVPESKEYNRCYCKVIVNTDDNYRVLGFHILAPNAGEICQGFGIGMKLGMTFLDLQDLVGIHPTVAEELTMLNITKRSGKEAIKSGC